MDDDQGGELGLAKIVERLSALAVEAMQLCERPIEPAEVADSNE